KRGPMAGFANMLGLGGGTPSAQEMQKLAERMPGGLPGLPGGAPGAPGLPPTMPGLPPQFPGGPLLPGLGGKPPGLGGLPGSGKKKLTFHASTNGEMHRPERNSQMSLKIRLARAGTKKRPVYHIVIADSRSPRDGRFIERLGYFNPLLPKDKTERLKLDLDKVKAWLAKGALPTDRVLRFLDQAGVM